MVLALAILCCVCVGCKDLVQPNKTRIVDELMVGMLFGPDNAPLPSVRVEVTGGELEWHGRTDSGGRFVVDLPPGIYRVTTGPEAFNRVPRWIFEDVEFGEIVAQLHVDIPRSEVVLAIPDAFDLQDFEVRLYSSFSSVLGRELIRTWTQDGRRHAWIPREDFYEANVTGLGGLNLDYELESRRLVPGGDVVGELPLVSFDIAVTLGGQPFEGSDLSVMTRIDFSNDVTMLLSPDVGSVTAWGLRGVNYVTVTASGTGDTFPYVVPLELPLSGVLSVELGRFQLEVQVTETDGSPIESNVTVETIANSRLILTDPQGAARMYLNPGRYAVSAFAGDRRSQRQVIDVTADQQATLVLSD